MNELIPFHYGDHEVRTVVIDGDPWFVLSDLCAVLTLSQPHRVAARLDDDMKGRTRMTTPGGDQEVTIVSEPGFYSVVMRSDKPEAAPFQRWVTSEVLPSIRKTGQYITRPASQIDILRGALDQIEAAQKAAEAAQLEATKANARIDGIEGRHDYYSALGYARLHGHPTESKGLASIGRKASLIGKERGIENGTAPHAHFGHVKTWPEWIWDEVYADLTTI